MLFDARVGKGNSACISTREEAVIREAGITEFANGALLASGSRNAWVTAEKSPFR